MANLTPPFEVFADVHELKLGLVLVRCYSLDMSETVEDRGWLDFRDQCRRQMRRPLEQRIKYGFCRMYKPVLDDEPWRAFDTMAQYRSWCAAHLPEYLGFKPVPR